MFQCMFVTTLFLDPVKHKKNPEEKCVVVTSVFIILLIELDLVKHALFCCLVGGLPTPLLSSLRRL